MSLSLGMGGAGRRGVHGSSLLLTVTSDILYLLRSHSVSIVELVVVVDNDAALSWWSAFIYTFGLLKSSLRLRSLPL